MRIKKEEKIIIAILSLGICFLILRSIWKDNFIDKNPIFILGKVYNVIDSENGLIYYFTYNVDSVEYKSSVKGLFKLQDSIMMLKLNKEKPQLWKRVEGQIPNCILKKKNNLRLSWTSYPVCK